MLSCRVIRKQMVDYLDGGLKPSLSDALIRHVSTCESCRKELESLRTASEAICAVRRVAASERIWVGVLERIRSIEEERSWAWRLLSRKPRYAFAVGIAVVLLGAASLLISPAGQSPPLLSILVSPFSPVGISTGV